MSNLNSLAPRLSTPDGILPMTDDVVGLRIVMANVFFIGAPGSSEWVLVDAGLHGSAGAILHAAQRRYGQNPRPKAILITHGHFDHVGALRELAELWDVPIYAHELELPYLTGRSSYPPPDPTVGGGAMARLSALYPRGPVDVGRWIQMLPSDGTIPNLPGWRSIHTPGHTPGHVSFFREADRVLIAGDAFVTTRQESFWSVLTQRQEIHGPPMYYTPDFREAWRSVQRLHALEPNVAGTGHGLPMAGEPLAQGLRRLASDFGLLAMPERGRYVGRPAIANAQGVAYVPPKPSDPVPKVLATLALGLAIGAAITYAQRRSND